MPGYPSTYMLDIDELLLMHHTLLAHLRASAPDYIIIEIADGIFQRETKLLIESPEFRASVDHVFFAANDSLSAVTGQMFAEKHNLPLHATAGRITMSPLATREAEQVTGLPCLGTQQILNGAALRLLESKPASRPDVGAAVHVLRVPGEPVPTRTSRRAIANGVAAR